MTTLDERDITILEVLRHNSLLSMQKIAHKTGIPVATVHNRIKKLRAHGVIRRYTIDIDHSKLGQRIVAFVLIKTTPKVDLTLLLRKLMQHGMAEEGSTLAGEFDIMLKVRAGEMIDLDRLVLKQFREYPEISNTQTMIVFENIEK